MANSWFRLYSEFANDPKVQTMTEAQQRRLVMLFCLKCSDVLVTLSDDEVAFALRVTPEDLAATKKVFQAKGFIESGWNLVNWNKRQFISDSSTERTRAYRERIRTSQLPSREQNETSREQAVTSSRDGVTLPDTDTDSDTEQTQIHKPPTAVKALTPHQLEMKRLKDLGWKGVAKTTDAACEKIIITIRETDFAPSSDLKSAYMIFTRLCWFVEFAGYFWECGAGPDQRRAREMYFEMVPDLETKELVESAIEAQAPAMLEREKKFRTQPHNWLKARSWEAARTLFGQ